MNMEYYPLKFKPIFKEKIWGGDKIKTYLKKDFSPLSNAGESWELSGVKGNISEIATGELKGKLLTEIINEYKQEIIGDEIYSKYNNDFPLLIKFIDSKDKLSVQVHPDDELAKKKHNSFGKTEMWVVLEADKGSNLISGFKKDTNKEEFKNSLENKNLEELLNYETVKKDDSFFIPSGRIHAICEGILLTEIQQTSDITYRVYDWNRVDKNGKGRELHVDDALEAFDFKKHDNYKIKYNLIDKNFHKYGLLTDSKYFKTEIYKEIIEVSFKKTPGYFNILIITEGEGSIKHNNKLTNVKLGDVYLIPAYMDDYKVISDGRLSLVKTFAK